jgi:hypothetical protein
MRKRDGHFCQFLHTDPIFPFSWRISPEVRTSRSGSGMSAVLRREAKSCVSMSAAWIFPAAASAASERAAAVISSRAP